MWLDFDAYQQKETKTYEKVSVINTYFINT